jgi:hypothetical protein
METVLQCFSESNLSQVLHKMGSENVHLCTHYVEENCNGFDFLKHHPKVGNQFLNHTVRAAGNETWTSIVNVETNEQSKHWMHTYAANKFKQCCLPDS